jgi:hypothetical protein
MQTKEIIDLLQSIAPEVSGSNFSYRFDNTIMIDKQESFKHRFFDYRMANFYFSTLKNVPNLECTLTESKTVQLKTLARIVQKENDEGVMEDVIEYYEVPHKELWCWDIHFVSTIKMIIEGTK